MITTKTRNLDKVSAMISSLPRNIRGGATKEAAEYLIGNDRRGFRHYPQQAAHVVYQRTFAYRQGFKTQGEGVQVKIVNDVDYAEYVRTRWAGSPWNWRTIPDVIASNTQGMLFAIKLFVDRWIKANEVK